MARVKTTVIPLADYPTGVHEFGPATVSNKAVRLGFSVARCTTATPDIWPNEATTIFVELEGSLDNGATWAEWGSWGAKGGIHVRKDGTELPESWMMGPLIAGNNRRLRIRVTITNGPLRSSGSMLVDE